MLRQWIVAPFLRVHVRNVTSCVHICRERRESRLGASP
jgi:hypothetical protein